MTANDRLKRGFASRLWGGLILATMAHVAVFAFWPELTAQDFSIDSNELEVFDITPEVELPPPPENIPRPKSPVVATVDIDENITIASTAWLDNPVETLPPPPDSVPTEMTGNVPVFTPYTVRPDVRNRDEVERAMEREYPPLLRDAGIGGTVGVLFHIDDEGRVLETRVSTSSGHQALDQAALKVAAIIRFTPALNRDRRVAVWISIPITFTIR